MLSKIVHSIEYLLVEDCPEDACLRLTIGAPGDEIPMKLDCAEAQQVCDALTAWLAERRQKSSTSDALDAPDAPVTPAVPAPPEAPAEPPSVAIRGAPQSLKWYEVEILLHVLEACSYNLTHAARALEIGRATLYRKLARYGLHAGDGSGRRPSKK